MGEAGEGAGAIVGRAEDDGRSNLTELADTGSDCMYFASGLLHIESRDLLDMGIHTCHWYNGDICQSQQRLVQYKSSVTICILCMVLYEVLSEYQEIESRRGQFKLLLQKMVAIKKKRHSWQELIINAYD